MKTTFVMTPTPVTASEARQSMHPRHAKMDCRASLAMTTRKGAV